MDIPHGTSTGWSIGGGEKMHGTWYYDTLRGGVSHRCRVHTTTVLVSTLR
jgi:hypothetical protein